MLRIVEEKATYYFYDGKKKIIPFLKWFNDLGVRDMKIIDGRLFRVKSGNYGDCKSVGNGIQELRFHQGYRIYFSEVGNTIVLLLCGGDKSSQEKDIAKAREYKRILDEKGLDYCIEK
jgi:putative addiction module killer protein